MYLCLIYIVFTPKSGCEHEQQGSLVHNIICQLQGGQKLIILSFWIFLNFSQKSVSTRVHPLVSMATPD